VTQFFLEREFEPALSVNDVVSIARGSGWCFEIYNVAWHGSLLSADGRRLVCQFSSADAESVRMALRRAEADVTQLWTGTVHAAPVVDVPANVLVERSFDAPVAIEDLQAKEDAKSWCLETHRVKFVRSFFARDRKRMLCLYSGPDAEAVRAAQHEAEMPVDRVWAFERIGPEQLGT
jgi:Nickel responsive protein SCO4226-like